MKAVVLKEFGNTTARLTAGCDTPIRSVAAVNPPCSVTASNARSCSNVI
jgi:hypothetical protein